MATQLSLEEEWKNFKAEHKKSYETTEEEAKRFEIFKSNLNHVREHNKKFDAGEVTYSQGINMFGDLTSEEFKKRHLGLRRE